MMFNIISIIDIYVDIFTIVNIYSISNIVSGIVIFDVGHFAAIRCIFCSPIWPSI